MSDTRIDEMRKNYTLGGLLEKDVYDDPMVQFQKWFDEAIGQTQEIGPGGGDVQNDVDGDKDGRTALLSGRASDAGIPSWLEPNAMTLSTATSEAVVSSRTVLLKGVEDGTFVFYSNYESKKGNEIATNPNVSLCFYWPHLQRQVLVSGKVAKVDRERSLRYFHSRPRASQLGALASVQSSTIDSRAVLEDRFAALDSRYPSGTEIPFPDHWGGYAVTPNRIEFWQGRTSRLHDRIVFQRITDIETPNRPSIRASANVSGPKNLVWSFRRLSP